MAANIFAVGSKQRIGQRFVIIPCGSGCKHFRQTMRYAEIDFIVSRELNFINNAFDQNMP